MEDLVNQMHGRWGQLQPVNKALYSMWVEVRQLYGPEGGENVVADGRLVRADGTGLQTAQIVPLPDIQPLPYGHFAGGGIGALVDLHGGGLHLLPDLLLCFAGEGALNLFACTGVPAGGDPGLPVCVGLAVAGDGLLADGARALR